MEECNQATRIQDQQTKPIVRFEDSSKACACPDRYLFLLKSIVNCRCDDPHWRLNNHFSICCPNHISESIWWSIGKDIIISGTVTLSLLVVVIDGRLKTFEELQNTMLWQTLGNQIANRRMSHTVSRRVVTKRGNIASETSQVALLMPHSLPNISTHLYQTNRSWR